MTTTTLSLFDLPPHVQDEVLSLRNTFDQIVRSGQPARPQLLTLAEQGRSVGGLYRLLKKWMTEGDMALVDKRYFSNLWAAKPTTKLPHEFLEWVGGQMLGNQRKSKPAYRAIIARWRKWKASGDPDLAIPGYSTPPSVGPNNHPEGWSYKNLMTQAQPPKAELTIARQGTAAAKKHLPFVVGTREGLRWLEVVYFDDVWHDRKCVVPGYLEPVRILQLGCLDHATGVYLKFGLRPDLPKDDGTRERLKRRDMLMLVASLLMEYGYPLDYTMHLVVERATATLTSAEARLLYDLSDGQIQVGYTSMDGAFVLAWMEGASGNAQGKGPLESWHNLFHNEQASLPGQVGKDRDHAPASLYGSDREAIALTKASLLMTREQRSGIQFPYPDLDEAHRQTLQVIARINGREDHQLEGFGKVALWRIRGTKTDFLPTSELAGVDPALESHLEWISRPEKPIERAERLSALTRVGFIPPGAMIRFYEDAHYPAKVDRRQARVSIAGKVFIFGLNDAEEMTLPEGFPIDLHFDLQSPSFALVTGANGLFLGVWPRQQAARFDRSAVALSMRRKQSFLNESVSKVRGKMAEQLAKEERRINANLSTLAAADIIPEYSITDAATGRETRSTPIAEGMQQAIEAHREQKRKLTEEDRITRSAARFGSALSDAAESSPEEPIFVGPVEDWTEPLSPETAATPVVTAQPNEPETW